MIRKDVVRAFFRDKTARPLSFRDIVQRMELSRPEARALKRVLREMLRSGELVMTRKGLYGPPHEMSLMTGYFELHRDGFGFVIPEQPGEQDIFIPPRATMGALNNDRVIARVDNWRKREGQIIRIIERSLARVSGRLEVTQTAAFVKPRKRSAGFDLFISQQDLGGAGHGDSVIAEITTYPTEKRPPSGRILKVLKDPGSPSADVDAIIAESNLPQRFPRDVTAEAKKLFTSPPQDKALPRRRDLRGLITITIDGERARDFDDAVSIEKTGQGYRLWVHIADVGFYVDWNTSLDLEARKRGTSVYFPDRVIPMLPKELSEDLCSLRPGADRYSMTVEMVFDRNGNRLGEAFYPSLIRSDERMTYTAVRKILVDHDDTLRASYGSLVSDLEMMASLCRVLRDRRLGRGSLDFDLPEPEVLLDMQGNPESIIRAERSFAHMIIEEFMIAANEAVSEYLERLGIPSLYRIHEPPDPAKFDDIARITRVLGIWRRRKLSAGDLPMLLNAAKGSAEEESITYLVLRSLKQARYAPVNVGHFGLASSSYTHFTSPIRRYPDLVVHRILREVLLKNRLSDRRTKELGEVLPDIAFHSSRMERLSDEAEKNVLEVMRVWFMKDKAGIRYPCTVTGVTPYGLRVRLRDLFIEGTLHVSSMSDDYYQYDERTMKLAGRHTGKNFRIGQQVELRIDRVDLDERVIYFGL